MLLGKIGGLHQHLILVFEIIFSLD